MNVVIVIIIAIILVVLLLNSVKGNWCRTGYEGLTGLQREAQAHSYMLGAGPSSRGGDFVCPRYTYAEYTDCQGPRFLGPASADCVWNEGCRTKFKVVSPGSTSCDYGTGKCDPFDMPYC